MENRIEKIRKRVGLTRWELAKRADIDPTTLYRLEKGKMVLYPGWRNRIAKALEVSEAELFEEENHGTEPGLE